MSNALRCLFRKNELVFLPRFILMNWVENRLGKEDSGSTLHAVVPSVRDMPSMADGTMGLAASVLFRDEQMSVAWDVDGLMVEDQCFSELDFNSRISAFIVSYAVLEESLKFWI